jgi:hypothetical protein
VQGGEAQTRPKPPHRGERHESSRGVGGTQPLIVCGCVFVCLSGSSGNGLLSVLAWDVCLELFRFLLPHEAARCIATCRHWQER